MALAGPSRLRVTPLLALYHLPTGARDSRLSSLGSHDDNDEEIYLPENDKGKGKHLEDTGDDVNLQHEREVWRDHPPVETGGKEKETDWNIEALFKEEEAKPAVEEEQESTADTINRLPMNLEMGRPAEDIPPPTPPPPAADSNAQQTPTLRRRLTSAFRKFGFKSKSHLVHDCVICQEPIEDGEVRVPCGHFYDKECIISLFQASTRDESLFPPRCCKQPIPLNKVQKNLPPFLLTEFVEKSKEFSTVKRVYCAQPRCSRFLGRQEEGWTWRSIGPKTYKCTCGMATCSRCKMAHGNNIKHSCSEKTDDGTEIVLTLGKVEGWARCPGCRTMIELNMGCYHMTCLCKAEFCYLCQARWKSCPCKQWDETRLVAAAEERIDLELELMEAAHRPAPVLARWNHIHNYNAMPPLRHIEIRPNRGELLQAAVDELRVNHDCQHARWRYRDGGGRCVGCYDILDRYVFHCVGCHTVACNRCRLNRF